MSTLFLVEDSEMLRARFVALFGASKQLSIVGQAADAPTAIARIATLRPTIVVLDIQLQVGTGIDVLKAVRPQLPDTVVITMTNNPSDHRRMQCLECGADYFFDKTLEFEQIVDAVNRVARNSSEH